MALHTLTIPAEAFSQADKDVLLRVVATGRPFGYADGPGAIRSARRLEWAHVPKRPDPRPRPGAIDRDVARARRTLTRTAGALEEVTDALLRALRDADTPAWRALPAPAREVMARRLDALDVLAAKDQPRRRSGTTQEAKS